MRIHLSADHRGYELAKALEPWLTESGYQVQWHGAEFLDEGDDYPLFTIRTAQAQIVDEDAGTPARSIVVGGDGSGEVIAANKVSGARATFASSAKQVELARKHADASILVLGSLHHDLAGAKALIEVFMKTEFGDLIDDARRIINTTEFEASGTIEGWLIGFEG
jgi:ribose 5-phosphate isomerase B